MEDRCSTRGKGFLVNYVCPCVWYNLPHNYVAKKPLPQYRRQHEHNEAEPERFFGHPKGLGPLFFTELWERFSYYGMRAILVLYMVAPPAQGGLGFDVKRAASIYGTYTMAVYLTALPGGLVADYLLGARLAVFLGGLIIAAGHFSMVFHSMTSFYLGMVLIAVGTGLLKPNISTMVGSLYRENDPRRDSGFSIFYMGINMARFWRRSFAVTWPRATASRAFLAQQRFRPDEELALGIWRGRRGNDSGSDHLRTFRQAGWRTWVTGSRRKPWRR